MITKTWKVYFDTQRKGQRIITPKRPTEPLTEGRQPRVSRLMALAHHLEQLVTSGQVKDYAELARLGRVTRARISQIMNLLLLAPDIQEEILFLPRVTAGSDPIHLRQLQAIAFV